MNKKDIKYIKQIADKLPAVYEQTVSGYYEDYNEQGELVAFPNMVNVEINHVRRIRKAFERVGMEGIKSYLEMIYKLQIKRNEQLQHNKELQREEESLDTIPSGTDTGSVDSGNQDQGTVQVDEGVVGVNNRKRRKGTEAAKKGNDKA